MWCKFCVTFSVKVYSFWTIWRLFVCFQIVWLNPWIGEAQKKHGRPLKLRACTKVELPFIEEGAQHRSPRKQTFKTWYKSLKKALTWVFWHRKSLSILGHWTAFCNVATWGHCVGSESCSNRGICHWQNHRHEEDTFLSRRTRWVSSPLGRIWLRRRHLGTWIWCAPEGNANSSSPADGKQMIQQPLCGRGRM